jgi:hypothetical protein
VFCSGTNRPSGKPRSNPYDRIFSNVSAVEILHLFGGGDVVLLGYNQL